MSEPPDWMEKMPGAGLRLLAGHDNQTAFFKMLHILLRCAYNEGRLSVMQEAWKAATAPAGKPRR